MAGFEPLVEAVALALRQRGATLVTAESCTGGLIAAACTALAGSSDWFERGFVSYSNAAKVEALGVDPALIDAHGAVSGEVACAMALGALQHSHADIAVAVTGIAGPGGATPGKPVGTVWLAWAQRGSPAKAELLHLNGDRNEVREQTVVHALRRVQSLAEGRGSRRLPACCPSAMAADRSTLLRVEKGTALTILVAAEFSAQEWADCWPALLAALPGETLLREVTDPNAIDIALVANPPAGLLASLPKLRLIQSLWAGVDRLLTDATLPRDVPLARLVDPAMSQAIAETVLWAVLSLHREYFDYAAQQQRGQWRQRPQRRADEVTVAVLGLGEMGRSAALRLAGNGYLVLGWSMRQAELAGVACRSGTAQLEAVLGQAEIVVNLLPLTDVTRDLFDRRTLASMRRGASLVNLGRGGHVVEADLLEALASGQLRRAVLDVFGTEPLASGHAFWTHPKVTVLPHIAALTDPRSAASVVARNVRALRSGAPLAHLVDRTRGY